MENFKNLRKGELMGKYRTIVVEDPATGQDRYGISDSTGNIIIQPKYYAAYIQNERFAACLAEEDSVPIFYDLTTGESLCRKYNVARVVFSSHDCQFMVQDENGRQGIIDYEGRFLIPYGKYDELHPNYYHIVCCKAGKYGVSRWSGEEALPCIYDEVCPFVRPNSKVDYDFFQIGLHDFNHIPVRLGDNWFYAGKHGKTLEVNAAFLGTFTRKGHAIIGLDNDFNTDAVIDTNGNIALRMPGYLLEWLDDTHLFYLSKADVDKIGIVSLDGKIIFPPLCPLSSFGPGLVRINDRRIRSMNDTIQCSAIFKIENEKLVQLTPFSYHPFGYGEHIYMYNDHGKYDAYDLDGNLIETDACDELIY